MPIIDPEQLIEHVDGDLEFLRETYEIFREENQTQQSNLRAAFNAADLEAVQSIAHSLKGMLSNFLAESASATANQIENIKEPQALALAGPLLDQLSSQIEMMDAEIKQTLEAGNC